MDEGYVVARINILLRGNITEGLSALNNKIFDKKDIHAIEVALSNKINERVRGVINKEEALGADFLKIGLDLYRKKPDLWNKYKDSQENLEIEFSTNVIVENTGVIE